MSPRSAFGRLLLLGLVALAAPADAEIYRCTGPDGNLRFTGDASECPGAKKHEPKRKIQKLPSAPTRRSPPARAAVTEEADAARWRGKKQQAEQQLAWLEARLPGMRKATTWCNRGDTLYRTDDLGRRSTVKCKDVIVEYQRLEQARAKAAHYLSEGLEEECRRSGCLPGWIR